MQGRPEGLEWASIEVSRNQHRNGTQAEFAQAVAKSSENL